MHRFLKFDINSFFLKLIVFSLTVNAAYLPVSLSPFGGLFSTHALSMYYLLSTRASTSYSVPAKFLLGFLGVCQAPYWLFHLLRKGNQVLFIIW